MAWWFRLTRVNPGSSPAVGDLTQRAEILRAPGNAARRSKLQSKLLTASQTRQARQHLSACRAFNCPSWGRTRTLPLQRRTCCQLHQGASDRRFSPVVPPNLLGPPKPNNPERLSHAATQPSRPASASRCIFPVATAARTQPPEAHTITPSPQL